MLHDASHLLAVRAVVLATAHMNPEVAGGGGGAFPQQLVEGAMLHDPCNPTLALLDTVDVYVGSLTRHVLTACGTTNGCVQGGATVATAYQNGASHMPAEGFEHFFAKVLEVGYYSSIVRMGRMESIVDIAGRCGCRTCHFFECKMVGEFHLLEVLWINGLLAFF